MKFNMEELNRDQLMGQIHKRATENLRVYLFAMQLLSQSMNLETRATVMAQSKGIPNLEHFLIKSSDGNLRDCLDELNNPDDWENMLSQLIDEATLDVMSESRVIEMLLQVMDSNSLLKAYRDIRAEYEAELEGGPDEDDDPDFPERDDELESAQTMNDFK